MKFWAATVFALCSIEAHASLDLNGWYPRNRAPADAEIELHIALHPSTKWSEIEQVALDIASPSHPNFRKHLSHQEVSSLIRPSEESSAAVTTWLELYNITGQVRGGMVEAEATIAQVEKLLSNQYFQYANRENEGEIIVRAPEYHIPAELQDLINFITPTNQFPFRKPQPSSTESLEKRTEDDLLSRSAISGRASCGSGDQTTPDCVKQVYNITYTPQPNRTTFAVFGTEAASFSARDLQTYLLQYNAPAAAAGATYQVIGNGDPAEGDGGIEAAFEVALDTQTLLGIAYPARGILYNLGGVFGPNATQGKTYDRFVSFLQDLVNNQTVPSVVSFSESAPEDTMDPTYARQLCSMMAMVGARGITLLFSSGNNGANGDQPTGPHNMIFEPEFPASCPWVTAVGGTTNMASEVGATLQTLNGGGLGYYASGGGFSALFPRPNYQNSVVPQYISANVPSTYSSQSGYNAAGRGIPDVSAFSTNVPATAIGLTTGVGGTSAATPIWAAVITILNDFQASRGLPPLGFINPWLYGLKYGIKDITGGGNNAGACIALSGCTLPQTLGYNVTTGWDAVTGLGSPNVGLLIQALQTNSSSTPPGSNSTSTGTSTSPTASASGTSSPGSTTSAVASPSPTKSSATQNVQVASWIGIVCVGWILLLMV